VDDVGTRRLAADRSSITYSMADYDAFTRAMEGTDYVMASGIVNMVK